jgi:hypothetical protein
LHIPGGDEKSGSLDENGFGRVDGIEPGIVTIEFPGLKFKKKI